MASLYEAGWRQGSMFTAVLPCDAVVLDADGQVARDERDYGHWVVAAQECDLDSTETNDARPTIELRPAHDDDPPQDWGIRSWKFRLTETHYVASYDSRTMVSAAVLTQLLATGAARQDPDEVRSRPFAMWLGKRYDRPALPPELLPLGKKIAEEVQRRHGRPTAAQVRDVLMQFDATDDPMRFSLFAVVADGVETGAVREWLAGVCSRIPLELGLVDEVEAAPASGISLQLIEDSYAADVSQLTWRPNQPGPEGA
jgi:hypothetical protein